MQKLTVKELSQAQTDVVLLCAEIEADKNVRRSEQFIAENPDIIFDGDFYLNSMREAFKMGYMVAVLRELEVKLGVQKSEWND